MSILPCRVLEIQDFILRSDFTFRQVVNSHTNSLNFITWNPPCLVSRNETIKRQYNFAIILHMNEIHLANITLWEKHRVCGLVSKLVKKNQLRSAKLLSVLKENRTNRNGCLWYSSDISGNASSRCHLSSRLLMFRRDKGQPAAAQPKSDNFAINWHMQHFLSGNRLVSVPSHFNLKLNSKFRNNVISL